MTEKERKKYIAYMALKDELEAERQHGYALSFGGEEASPEEIARICVFEEEASYMRDYGKNPSGSTPILDFHIVRK